MINSSLGDFVGNKMSINNSGKFVTIDINKLNLESFSLSLNVAN